MEKFDFKTGEVILNDFDFEDNKSYAEQIWSFKEDILQVRYKKNNVIDLGWYPEFDLEEGYFKLIIVKKDDWLNPIFCKTTKSIKEVRDFIAEAVDIAESLE
ncbi:hypothetical protein NSU18_06630 [Paenibacillus sp. FSL H8-0048]|uniref:hypothetical protein n=1 Tax=Paenibacillus sp. FSL H8-0048 TaxID=2954508 RepID=UPI0030F7B77D